MSRMLQSHRWPAKRQRAFTLIEIAVVVVIIGLLAALGIPGYRKVTLKSRATATVNDFRVFSAALNTASLQNSGWPPGGYGPGVIPPAMTNAFAVTFTAPTPIGGKYEWISDSTYKAAIGITTDGSDKLTDDVELIEMIDRMMDDGDTSTGNVQISVGKLVYIIEP